MRVNIKIRNTMRNIHGHITNKIIRKVFWYKPQCNKKINAIKRWCQKRCINIINRKKRFKYDDSILRVIRNIKSREFRIMNKEYFSEYVRVNKLKYRSYWHKRNSLINNTDDGSVSDESLRSLLIIQNYKCNSCNQDISKDYHIDHIIPLSKGGHHTIKNLQMLCPFCNLSKGNKLFNNINELWLTLQ